jgi:hypothetical protein
MPVPAISASPMRNTSMTASKGYATIDRTDNGENGFPRLRAWWSLSESCARYLSLAVCPARQARNAAAACSRSSALLSLRRGCFGGWLGTSGVLPLISSTPCRCMRSWLSMCDQFMRRPITHSLSVGSNSFAFVPIRAVFLDSNRWVVETAR